MLGLNYKLIGALIGALIIFLSGFRGGMLYERQKWQARELALIEKVRQQEKKAEGLAHDYEILKTEKQKVHTKIVRKVITDIVSRVEYRCEFPADGLRILNSAIDNANGPSKPDGAVSSDSAK